MKAPWQRTFMSIVMMIITAMLATGCNTEDRPTFTITPQAGPHGEIYPNTPKTVEKGTIHTFVITPEDGYQAFAIGCGGTLNSEDGVYTTQPITADCVIEATFTPTDNGDATAFTVTPKAEANGKIDPSTPQTVTSSQSTKFTITPDQGYTASVTGCDGKLVENTYTTGLIKANCTVTATFTPASNETFTVTPDVGPNGALDPNTRQTVQSGAVISFKVMAEEGYTAVVEGCGGVLTRDSYTTSPINADCTVTARFEGSTDDDGDINTSNAKKVLDTALVTLIVVQTNTSGIFIDHLVNGPSSLEIPGLTRAAGVEDEDLIPCDDPDPRRPSLNTGLSYLIEGSLSRKEENTKFSFREIRLADFNGAPVCKLGSGNPGTMSNLLDNGLTSFDVSIDLTSKGADWLDITSTIGGYGYYFNKQPMIINLSSPHSVVVSGVTTTEPYVDPEFTIDWTNTFGEPDTIRISAYEAPEFSETRYGGLVFAMNSRVLNKLMGVRIPGEFPVYQEPTTAAGAYLTTDYQGKEILQVVAPDETSVSLFCRELHQADAKTGFFCKSFEYRVNGGEAKTYLP